MRSSYSGAVARGAKMIRNGSSALLMGLLLACPAKEPAPTPIDAGATVDASLPHDASSPIDTGPVCGDGQKQANEACDDGNTNAGDGCNPSCALEAGQIELAQPEPQAEMGQAILIRGAGFRYDTTLRVCVMQDTRCRFELTTLTSDQEGRVQGPEGQAASLQVAQPLEASIALCDDELGTCSNALDLRWIELTNECAQDSDCALAQHCDEGRCVAAPPSCQDDTECPNGHQCEGGICIDPAQIPCENTPDCPPGDTCINGRCVEPDRPCTSHRDCPLHQACDFTEDLCAPLTGSACREDQQCQIICVIEEGSLLGRCIDCEGLEDCPEGAVCNQGRCVEPTCNEQNCPAPGRCENDRCVGLGIDCNEENCPPPSRCDNNQCLHNDQPEVCQNHGQCQAAEQCLIIGIQGVCVSLCNVGHQQQACAGQGNGECICNMLQLSCNHQTGFCE